jgi:hypothetical protein
MFKLCVYENRKRKRGAGFDLAERTVEWIVDPLNLIQVMLAEGIQE